jgi:hypothetical protein
MLYADALTDIETPLVQFQIISLKIKKKCKHK